MADLPEQQQPQPQPAPTPTSNANPVISFFSNFLKLFNMPPPFAKKTQQVEEERDSSALSGTTKANPVVDEVAVQSKKPSVVRYPQPAQEEFFPSLTVEGDEVQERNSNPATLWQVYALGSFLVLSWAWKRWNERRGGKKSSDEDPQAPE